MPKLEKEIIIVCAQGLHARPAAMFVQLATKYESDIIVEKEKEQVNGKSIMGILMLGAQQGTKIKIIVKGDDAQAALEELTSFLSQDHETYG